MAHREDLLNQLSHFRMTLDKGKQKDKEQGSEEAITTLFNPWSPANGRLQVLQLCYTLSL